MIRAPARAILALSIMLMVVAGLGWAVIHPKDEASAPRPQSRRPALLLLTSLPLLFDEGFTLKSAGSPATKALQSRYRVVPISTAAASELSKGRMLLMAHAPAQTAENLVALDDWVRRGGRVMLLADPLLEWPSKRPLGDPLRPSPMFTDTGLLGHWGLRLDAPDRRGLVALGGGRQKVIYISPGRLVSSNPNCLLSRANIVADCKIGAGRAIVVADADFLNVSDLAADAQQNLAGLLEQLATLESD